MAPGSACGTQRTSLALAVIGASKPLPTICILVSAMRTSQDLLWERRFWNKIQKTSCRQNKKVVIFLLEMQNVGGAEVEVVDPTGDEVGGTIGIDANPSCLPTSQPRLYNNNNNVLDHCTPKDRPPRGNSWIRRNCCCERHKVPFLSHTIFFWSFGFLIIHDFAFHVYQYHSR